MKFTPSKSIGEPALTRTSQIDTAGRLKQVIFDVIETPTVFRIEFGEYFKKANAKECNRLLDPGYYYRAEFRYDPFLTTSVIFSRDYFRFLTYEEVENGIINAITGPGLPWFWDRKKKKFVKKLEIF